MHCHKKAYATQCRQQKRQNKASLLINRILQYTTDTNIAKYDNFFAKKFAGTGKCLTFAVY